MIGWAIKCTSADCSTYDDIDSVQLGVIRVGQRKTLRQSQGAAIGVPQSVTGMDQCAHGRGPERLGAPRPPLKGKIGRSVEGIEGGRTQSGRQLADNAPTPAIEPVRLAIEKLRDGGIVKAARCWCHGSA